MALIESLQLSLPWALLALVLFLPALLIEIRRRGPRESIAMADTDELRAAYAATALRRKLLRVAVIATIALLIALALSGPVLRSVDPLLAADRLATQKNIILAIDVSRSMSGPLELPDREARLRAYGTTASSDLQSRYEAARDTAYRFIERFPDARIGLILFSTEPFLARWPTVETDGRFAEVLDENLDELTQLRRFSSLTNTDAALRLAGRVFNALETQRGGAVVHISDAEDELENMGLAIRELRQAGIRQYTFGVGIAESIVEKLSSEFAGDPGFRIFRVDSEEEMREAYRLVAELEESPRYTEAENTYLTDLRRFVALLLAILALPAVYILEIRLPRSRLAYPLEHRDG